MPKKFTPKIAAALKKAWEAGTINLCDVCPSCFKHMSYMDHSANEAAWAEWCPKPKDWDQ